MSPTSPAAGSGWLVVVLRLPGEPSRHRVAAWRELRRAGAVQLSPGTWALPDVDADVVTNAAVVERVRAITSEAGGELTLMRAAGSSAADEARLRAVYAAAREQDWSELCGDCEKLLAEIDREIAAGKFTLAELEEEEHSLERLRRWHAVVRARDVFGPSDGAARAEQLLHRCGAALADFEQRVFAATSPDDQES